MVLAGGGGIGGIDGEAAYSGRAFKGRNGAMQLTEGRMNIPAEGIGKGSMANSELEEQLREWCCRVAQSGRDNKAEALSMGQIVWHLRVLAWECMRYISGSCSLFIGG